MNKSFFFDTANETFIRKIWQEIKDEFSPTDVKGITTNPKALFKVKTSTIKELEKTIPSLCRLVTEIRENEPGGEVFVQVPNSNLSVDNMLAWARFIIGLSDGVTTVSMKIPPYEHVLSRSVELQNEICLNVTGVSDAAMILRVFSHPGIEYASLIPGRMEEVGIDARSHLQFLENAPFHPNQNIIAGSMRTLDGLEQSIMYGTIPTIGEGVWDKITETRDNVLAFSSYWSSQRPAREPFMSSIVVDQRNLDLSSKFFSQMNEYGITMSSEFLKGFVEAQG